MTSIKWYLCDKTAYRYISVIDKFFENGILLKKNKKRSLYKLCIEDRIFYIKHDHPKELRHRIKSLFFPKARSEFNSAMILKKAGIPTVPVLGWGKKGYESFLITEELPDAILLKDLLSFFYNFKKDMNSFLTYINSFLKLLVEKKVSHPDLHPGNVLVKKTEKGFSFYLVDLYGVKIKNSLDKKHIFELFGWLVTVLWPFEWNEIERFLLLSGFCKDKEEVKERWKELVKWKIEFIKRKCKKRRKKLLKNSSLCSIYNTGVTRILIKKQLENKSINNGYLIRYLPNNEAEKAWLNSYFLELFGIPTADYSIWIRNKHRSALLIKIPDSIRSEDNKDKLLAIKKLYEWGKMAGIDISLDQQQIYIRDDAVFPLLFLNPERFSLNV